MAATAPSAPTLFDLAALERAAWDALIPARPAGLWDWAVDNVVLPMGESSSLAAYDTARAGLFRRMLNVVSCRRLGIPGPETDPHAHRCEQAWAICSAQLGKTMNMVYTAGGWVVRHWPHVPTGFVWPRQDVRKQQLRARLEPLFQATPELALLLPPLDSEDYEKLIGERLWRLLNGARPRMLVGNIANDCRSNPLACIFADEFDALLPSVGEQGDPLQLLIDRQRTFRSDRLFVGATTPTTVIGHGWRRLCSGTHERMLLECPECEGVDWLNPDHLRPTATVTDPKDIRRHDAALWHCQHCGVGHNTDAVREMVRDAIEVDRWCAGAWTLDDDRPRGQWLPKADLDGNGRLLSPIEGPDEVIRSWHLNLIASPLVTLGEFLAAELTALAGREEDKQAHWNTARAEPWLPAAPDPVDDAGRAEIVVLGARLGAVPAWADFTMLTFDQQGNTEAASWFPWALRAYARGGRSQLVDAGKVEKPGLAGGGWPGAELLGERLWPADTGAPRKATVLAMDGANGNQAMRVRTWAAKEIGRRILFWGSPKLGPDEPWRIHVPSKRAKVPMPRGVRALEIHPTYWRERLDERRRRAPGALEWTIPEGAPSFYLRSVWDSEVRVVVQRQVTGQGVREIVAWQPMQTTDALGHVTFRRDNHWWDIEAAGACVAHVLGWDKAPPTGPSAPPRIAPRGPTYPDRRRSFISRRRNR